MSRRTQVPLLAERLDALLACPLVHRLGDTIPDNDVGRPRHHPAAAHLAFAALGRIWRSGARADGELRAMWPEFVTKFNAGADDAGTELIDERAPVLGWDNFRRARNRICDDDAILELLCDTFTAQSLRIARELGLLDPTGAGSLTTPHRSRVVYGDGTVIRPLYKAASELDDGEARAAGTRVRRHDPDAATHVRHDGKVIGHNFVALHTRTPDRWGRVVLALDHVPAPGKEAATAVSLIKRLHAQAGGGIQAIVYDGALLGTHLNDLMTSCGLVVINKVAAASTPAELKAAGTKLPKQVVVGTYTHTPNGATCSHTVMAQGGQLVEAALDDAGEPTVVDGLRRVQVKRSRRGDGTYRFSLGAEINCTNEPFTIWVSPHPERGDTTNRRPENIRLIPQGDPAFDTYSIRNDAESFNAALKQTLLSNRAMSLGWKRQLLDILAYSITTNAHAWAANTRQCSRRLGLVA